MVLQSIQGKVADNFHTNYKCRPNFVNTLTIMKYSAAVSARHAAREKGKLIPFRNIQGSAKNIGKEGNTYQKVPSAWVAILETFTFSPYIQIIPRTEIRGMDAIRLPIKGSFLETSDIITMISAETKSFTKYQIMVLLV